MADYPVENPTPTPGEAAAPNAAPDEGERENPEHVLWRARISRCRELRRRLIDSWSTNVDYRRGKQFDADSDQDRIAITIDWSATKAKQAQLFSQVPEVRLTPKTPAYRSAVTMFGKKVNDALCKARVGVAMDEALPDCINAAGIGAVLVSYEARMETVNVPSVPREIAAQMQAAGQEVPTQPSQRKVDSRICVTRISPADFLWPIEFTGSDFDDAPWKGRSGRLPWPIAKNIFNLSEEDKEKVVGTDDRTHRDVLNYSTNDTMRYSEEKVVAFDEIFYTRNYYDANEPHYDTIWRIVFVRGKKEPVVHEPWKGQRVSPDGKRIQGSCKNPVRVLTLTYLSDESIPPSDSAVGRPQVDELIRSRSQMILQRENSKPLRWFDVNRVDIGVQDTLMRGTWQGMVPLNGNGMSAIGEVARASYPAEDFEFDRIAKSDLGESWQVSPNQMGSFASGGRSASEAQIAQTNFQTRIGYERARVVNFFVGIAEVVAGLLSLYGDFTDEEMQALGQLPKEELSNYYAYTVRADSTVLLDSEQRYKRLAEFLNLTAKSGYVDVMPIIAEMADMAGVDAAAVRPPEKPGPDPMNVSMRASGSEDLMNPIVLALLMKTGQAPSPDELNAAKQLIKEAQIPIDQMPPAQPGPGPVPPPDASGALPPGAPAVSAMRPLPGAAHPEWQLMDKVNKRVE